MNADVPGSRVNVLFVTIQMTGMGGSERLVLDLVRNLDRRVFSPSVAWFVGEEPLAAFKALDVPLHYIPKRSRFDWRAMSGLAKVIRDERIDVVNAHHFMSFVYASYGSRVRRRIPLFYTEHSEHDVQQVSGKWKVFGRTLLPSCETIGISQPVSERLRAHFRLQPAHVHTIANGVDLALFGRAGRDRGALRAGLGLAPEDIAIAHVANFKRNKNHRWLLEAFARLRAKQPNLRLILIGRGFESDEDNSEAEIVEFIRQHRLTEHVLMLGYRPDVHDILAAADLFALVSEREGLPLSLIEAMAAGLPVVGSRVDGIREVIRDGSDGFLVPSGNVEDLVMALGRLVAEPALRRRMGDAARTTAAQNYSLARCIDQTQELFFASVTNPRTGSRPEPAFR